MTAAALDLVRAVDAFIQQTEPFRLIKQQGQRERVGSILYHAAEALRIASLLLWPVLPNQVSELWQRMGLTRYNSQLDNHGRGELVAWLNFGQLEPGLAVRKGEPLFPRHIEP